MNKFFEMKLQKKKRIEKIYMIIFVMRKKNDNFEYE